MRPRRSNSKRVDRVRELLWREFGAVIRHLKDPRIGLVTVVDTEVSSDLRYARFFVSVLGDENEQREIVEVLEGAKGFIRRQIAQRVRLRYVPELSICYDSTSERAARINALIDGLSPSAGEGESGQGSSSG